MPAVIASIPVGVFPTRVSVTPDGTRCYVANEYSGSVSVIDNASRTVIATVDVGGNQAVVTAVVVNPNGLHAYAITGRMDSPAATLFVIDTTSNTVTATVAVGNAPLDVAITPDGSRAYVGGAGDARMSVVNLASNTVEVTIPIPGSVDSVAIAPTAPIAYVMDSGFGLDVIDTRTNGITATIDFGGKYPTAVAISPNGDIAYVTDLGAGAVVVIDIASGTVINTISVGNLPIQTAFSPNGTLAYVANAGDGTLSIIDTASHTAIIAMPVGQAPRSVAFSPDGTLAYVTDTGGGNIGNPVDGKLHVISVAAVPVDNWQPPELSGTLLGAVVQDGGGWLVIGNHFIFIPPRSPFMTTVAEAAVPYLDQAVEEAELAQHVQTRLRGKNAVNRSVDG